MSLTLHISMMPLLAVLALAACVGKTDKSVRALGYFGRSEAELVREIGQPIVRRRVNELEEANPLTYCRRDEASLWALEYHVPSEGLEHSIRSKLGWPPSVLVVICVDAAGMVIATQPVSLN